jgi:hypothetical protein
MVVTPRPWPWPWRSVAIQAVTAWARVFVIGFGVQPLVPVLFACFRAVEEAGGTARIGVTDWHIGANETATLKPIARLVVHLRKHPYDFLAPVVDQVRRPTTQRVSFNDSRASLFSLLLLPRAILH